MARMLMGKPVAESLDAHTRERVELLTKAGITPELAIVRIGENGDDLSYERTAIRRCEKLGVKVRVEALPEHVSAEVYYETVRRLGQDETVHGILLFRPLPKHIDEAAALSLLPTEKDVDGCTDGSLAAVFRGTSRGFAPCTAQAVMEILDAYGIDPAGKDVTVLGRSLVVGRPLAMLLMHRQATPTICHTRTKDVPAQARRAEILVAAIDREGRVDREYLSSGQTVIDVGIHWNEELQALRGDVDPAAAEELAQAVTPVPGGVGTVTTSVLISHVTEAAQRWLQKKEENILREREQS